MASLNKVTIIGNLGADIDLKYTQSSKAVANMSVGCNETWKDKAGQKQEHVEWVRCVVWGVTAENCAKYLSKGSQVYVEGRLRTSSYEKDGQKRYSTEVVADKVLFLGGGKSNSNSNGGRQERSSGHSDPPDDGAPPMSDDDIPF